jgi:hypothetical protein
MEDSDTPVGVAFSWTERQLCLLKVTANIIRFNCRARILAGKRWKKHSAWALSITTSKNRDLDCHPIFFDRTGHIDTTHIRKTKVQEDKISLAEAHFFDRFTAHQSEDRKIYSAVNIRNRSKIEGDLQLTMAKICFMKEGLTGRAHPVAEQPLV